MESQMIRPQDYAHEQDPYQAHDPRSAAGGEEQREKKSVLKKVKAKAKKIKNSIVPKHGNGKNNGNDDHDHAHDRNIPDDHDLDEEDEYEDSEESSEGPEVHGAPIYESEKAVMSGKGEEDVPLSSFSESPKESNTFVPGSESNKVNLETPGALEEDPHAPSAHHQNPSNYQTKVADPTGAGAGEVGINPILSSFGKMNIDEKSNESYDSPVGTGSHDQFSTETPASTPTTGYVSSATSALANRALSAKNMVASKLGYGEKDNTAPQTSENKPATSAFADRAVSAKNTVTSKLGYGEKDENAPESVAADTAGESKPATSALTDSAISAKNTVASKLGYGEKNENAPESVAADTAGENKPATSALADRAISAKNLVASKLGYGEKDNTAPETVTTTPDENRPATATDYGKKIASTVYGTVTGAGTAVMSKIPRGGGGGEAPESESPVEETAAKAEDKGVSVKEYLAEKLRPGEDDTALSEAITDAIHKRQPEEEPPRAAAPELGKVTESEEVTRRLGDDGEGETKIEGKGSGYVDKVKGTVTSWLGYGDQSSKGSPKSPGEKVDDDLQGKEELKLQDSSKY